VLSPKVSYGSTDRDHVNLAPTTIEIYCDITNYDKLRSAKAFKNRLIK